MAPAAKAQAKKSPAKGLAKKSPAKDSVPKTPATPSENDTVDTTGQSTPLGVTSSLDGSGAVVDTPVRRSRGRPYDKVKLKMPKKIKKRRPSQKIQFSGAIHKVLKTIHPDCTMSRKAMGVMNNLVVDFFERIATETTMLAHYSKRTTLTHVDVKSACRLLMPGSLSAHAMTEGTKAVNLYNKSKSE